MSRKTRNLMWSAAAVAAVAVIGALAALAAQPPGPAEAHGPPGPVEGVVAAAASYNAITLSWSKPDSGGEPTGYRVDVSMDANGSTWTTLEADTGDAATMYRHTGLQPNTRVFYRVFALNGAGTGPANAGAAHPSATTLGLQAPSRVRNLKAVSSSRSVRLSWEAPAETGGGSIIRYCIVAAHVALSMPEPHADCAAASPTFTEGYLRAAVDGSIDRAARIQIVTERPETEYLHDNLVTVRGPFVGAEWKFQVYAVSSLGAARTISRLASNRAAAPVGQLVVSSADASEDYALTNLRMVQSRIGSSRSARLYWNEAVEVAEEDAKNTAFRLNYVIGRKLFNPASGGSYPDAWTEFPAAVTPKNIFSASGPSALVAHHPDVNTAGNLKGMYRIRRGTPNDGEGGEASDWSNTFEYHPWDDDLGDLESDDALKFVPRLRSLSDKSVSSQYDKITLFWTLEGATGVDANDDGDFDDANELAPYIPTAYIVEYRNAKLSIDGTFDGIYSIWREVETVPVPAGKRAGDTMEFTHSGLTEGLYREYRVMPEVTTGSGNSVIVRYGEPDAVLARTRSALTPGFVTGLQVASDNPNKLTLTWPEVTETNGAPITSYRIEVAVADAPRDWPAANLKPARGSTEPPRAGRGALRTVDAGSGSHSFTYTDTALFAGSVRFFRVIPINAQNDHDVTTGSAVTIGPRPSDTSGAEVVRGVTQVPGDGEATFQAPEGLTVEMVREGNLYGAGSTGALLLWNKPLGIPLGGVIDDYRVSRKVDAGDWEILERDESIATMFTDPSPPDGMLAYRVRGVLADDTLGDWSAPAYYPARHTETTAHVAARVPNPLPAQTVAAGAMVKVNAAGGFTGSVVGYAARSSDTSIVGASADDMGMVTITGVGGGEATVTVTATGAGGETATQTIAVMAEGPPLGKPADVTAMLSEDPGAAEIVVTWTDGANAETHQACLVPTDGDVANIRCEAAAAAGTHTFSAVAPDVYVVAVVALSGDEYEYTLAAGTVTVEASP